MHIELANLGHGVYDEGVGWVGERGLGEGFGALEEGEGDLGVVFEAEEGGGEGDAVELEAWLGGVEGVVVLQEELRDQFGVAFVARWRRREGAEAAEEWRIEEREVVALTGFRKRHGVVSEVHTSDFQVYKEEEMISTYKKRFT